LCADVLSAALDSGVAIAIILIFFWYFLTFFVANDASSFPEKSSISQKWDYSLWIGKGVNKTASEAVRVDCF